MSKVMVYCHNLSKYDRETLSKVMTAGANETSSGVLPYELVSFKKKETIRLTASLNIVCADFQPLTEGEALVYYWPSPKIFMADEAKKLEVWQELSGSLIPMMEVMTPEVEDNPEITLMKSALSLDKVSEMVTSMLSEGKKYIIKTEDGYDVHIYPGEKPGENERELTVQELLVLTFGMMTLGGKTVTVTTHA